MTRTLESLDLPNSLKTLVDIFPTSSIALGGSYARRIIVGALKGVVVNDIDVYLNASICRYAFVEILKHVVFKGIKIDLPTEKGDTPGDPGYYKMPHMRRRIQVDFPNGEYPSHDFIFLDPTNVPDVSNFLLNHQASTVSECAIKIDMVGRPKAVTSHAFDKVFTRGTSALLNTHADGCTEAQAAKVRNLCKNNRISLVEFN